MRSECGKKRARRKKRGRGLLTTRLIRTVLLAFYNGTFVSNTDFKKQTLLSQRRCWLRSRIALFSPFPPFVLPRAPHSFYFVPGPLVKGVWQNLNCEMSVSRFARKPEASAREYSLSLSPSRFLSFFSRQLLAHLFAHHLRLARSSPVA